MNSIETLLNLGWAFVCIGGLIFLRLGRLGKCDDGLRSRRMLSVFLAAVSLFPVISASDDRVRLSEFGAAVPEHSSVNITRHHDLTLSQQLEDLEHGQTTAVLELIVVMCMFVMPLRQKSVLARGLSLTPLGRAPPCAA